MAIGLHEPGYESNGQLINKHLKAAKRCDERCQETSLCLSCSSQKKSGDYPPQDDDFIIMHISRNVNARLVIFLIKYARLRTRNACFEHIQELCYMQDFLSSIQFLFTLSTLATFPLFCFLKMSLEASLLACYHLVAHPVGAPIRSIAT